MAHIVVGIIGILVFLGGYKTIRDGKTTEGVIALLAGFIILVGAIISGLVAIGL